MGLLLPAECAAYCMHPEMSRSLYVALTRPQSLTTSVLTCTGATWQGTQVGAPDMMLLSHCCSLPTAMHELAVAYFAAMCILYG